MEAKSESFESSNESNLPSQSEDESVPNPKASETLNDKIQHLETELEALKESIQKRKQENTALKILLYTGFILLLIGFIYSNTTLQRMQLQRLGGNVKIYQDKIQRDLIAVQENLLQQSRILVQEELVAKKAEELQIKTGSNGGSREAITRSLLEGVNQVVSRLLESQPELQAQANNIRKQTNELLNMLEAHKNSISTSETSG